MENYLSKIFESSDPNARSAKASPEYHQPSNTMPTSLEVMQPFSVDKRDGSFKSVILRDPLHPPKDAYYNPGPGAYNPKKPANKVMVGGGQRTRPNFGANARRNDLMKRNVAIMPYGDPTHLKGPSPVKYSQNPE
jgi:hypothetical protein